MPRYALLVGVNQYRHLTCLDFAEKDVHELADLLENKLGFARVKCLTGSYVDAARVEQFLEEIDALLQPGDVFLFYFSGHGFVKVSLEGEESDQLLQFASANLQLLRENIPTRGTLSCRTLHRLTEGASWHGVQRVFILDACRTGLEKTKSAAAHPHEQFSAETLEIIAKGMPQPGDRAASYKVPQATWMFACDGEQEALEVKLPSGRCGGVFTMALLDEWRDKLAAGMDIQLSKAAIGAVAYRMHRLLGRTDISPGVAGADVVLTPPQRSLGRHKFARLGHSRFPASFGRQVAGLEPETEVEQCTAPPPDSPRRSSPFVACKNISSGVWGRFSEELRGFPKYVFLYSLATMSIMAALVVAVVATNGRGQEQFVSYEYPPSLFCALVRPDVIGAEFFSFGICAYFVINRLSDVSLRLSASFGLCIALMYSYFIDEYSCSIRWMAKTYREFGYDVFVAMLSDKNVMHYKYAALAEGLIIIFISILCAYVFWLLSNHTIRTKKLAETKAALAINDLS